MRVIADEDPHLAEQLADELGDALPEGVAGRPPSPRPTLILFAGVPLSGKSTMARALVAHARTRTVHVENDALRPAVARRLGVSQPTYSATESFVTYRTAWELARRALDAGANVVLDATNLDEGWRRGAYDVAEERDAPVVVAFVQAPERTRNERAARADESRREAHRKLGVVTVDVERCSRSHVVLDGARPPAENVALLRREPALVALFAAR